MQKSRNEYGVGQAIDRIQLCYILSDIIDRMAIDRVVREKIIFWAVMTEVVSTVAASLLHLTSFISHSPLFSQHI